MTLLDTCHRKMTSPSVTTTAEFSALCARIGVRQIALAPSDFDGSFCTLGDQQRAEALALTPSHPRQPCLRYALRELSDELNGAFEQACATMAAATGLTFVRQADEEGCDFFVRAADETEEEEEPRAVCESFHWATPHCRRIRVWASVVEWDARSVFLHALGHALGLRHADGATGARGASVMSWAYLRQFRRGCAASAELSALDLARLSTLYPRAGGHKRALEEEEPPVVLPDDVLVHIARLGEWHTSGALARASHALLRLFTRRDVLVDIVHSLVSRGACLLRWLQLSLPCALLGADALVRAIDVPLLPALDGDVLVTGGALCQRLYGRAWPCDIDLFLKAREPGLTRVQFRVGAQAYDVVPVHDDTPVERSCEYFDLSVVQQGYVTAGGACQHYCTPLALFSWLTREIVCIPTNECASYTAYGLAFGDSWEVLDVSIWCYIDRHARDCQPGPYHACAKCEEDPSSGHQAFRRQRRRMRLYAARFPDFPLLCVRAPANMPRRPFDYSPLQINDKDVVADNGKFL